MKKKGVKEVMLLLRETHKIKKAVEKGEMSIEEGTKKLNEIANVFRSYGVEIPNE